MTKVKIYYYSITFTTKESVYQFKEIDLHKKLREYFCKLKTNNKNGFEDNLSKGRLTKMTSLSSYEHMKNEDIVFQSDQISVEIGKYGLESKLVDKNTFSVSHYQKKIEAQMHPFCFSLFYNEDQKVGVLAIEAIGHSKNKDIVVEILKNVISDPSIEMRLLPIHPVQVVKKLFGEGTITEIRLKKFHSNKDVANSVDGMPFYSENVVVRYQKPIFQNRSNFIKSLFSKDTSISKIVGIDQSEDVEDIEFTVKSGNAERTVKYNSFCNVDSFEDITKSIEFADNGYHSVASVFLKMDESAIFYLSQLKLIPDEITKDILRFNCIYEDRSVQESEDNN